jgi:RHS repeat-associated protein
VKQGLGPDLRESTYQYNAQGFLHTATDPLLHALAFEYDQAGRVTSGILPDSREISYAYDAGGNMTSLTPSGRPSHVFTYTPVNLIAEYNPPDIGIGTVKTEYSYNTDRQLTQVLRPDGVAFDFSYDSGGRLSAITYPGGPLSYTYDPVKGYLIQIDSPSGISNTYAHDGTLVTSETWAGAVAGSVSWTNDNSFRITGISINGGNAIAYQYDNDSLITKAGDLTLTRSAQNGFLTGSTLGNVTDAWTYNSFGEPASYTARYGANEIFKQQFTYDKLGRISQKVETEGVTDTYEYVYDASGRLTEVKKNGTTTSTYTYDSNDNRLTGPSGTTTYSYDAQDRLITQSSVLGTQSYSHTANGELQSKTISGQTTLYNYDVFGNLKSVTLPGNTLIEYMVDGQNRCIGKKVNSIWVRKFLYLSGLKPVAELDADDAIVSVFVYGSRFNVPDYMIRGGVTYRIISDHLGSPRLVVDTAGGTVIQSIDYDEFGNVVNDTNPGFQPFGFAGGLYDHQTKLVRFGMRDYDAESGRWTTKDPILFGGDQENLYAYVGNDPLNETDVLGTIIFGGGGKRPETPSPNTNIRPPRPTEPPPPPPPPKTPRRPPPDLRGAPGGTWGLKCVPIVVELLRRIVSNPSFIVRAGVRAF